MTLPGEPALGKERKARSERREAESVEKELGEKAAQDGTREIFRVDVPLEDGEPFAARPRIRGGLGRGLRRPRVRQQDECAEDARERHHARSVDWSAQAVLDEVPGEKRA